MLGDWYANRLNIGRHRLILCTSEATLLTVVVPAKDLLGLPIRLAESVSLCLQRIGVPLARVQLELNEMQLVRFDRTVSRSILGSMNDFILSAYAFVGGAESDMYLDDLDARLNETPCKPLGYMSPTERARLAMLGAA